MAIYKAKVEESFATIHNTTLQDKRLSFEARGVLCLILSLPSDWEVRKAWLQEQGNIGKDKLTRVLGELQKAGYMRRVPKRDKRTGKMAGVDWHVYPVSENAVVALKPENTVDLKNRTPVNPSSGKAAPTKERDLQNKDLKNILIDAFEIFWNSGMQKVNKQKAFKSFCKHVQDTKLDPIQFANSLRADIRKRIRLSQFGFNKLHPTTYLNQQRWEDEYCTESSGPNDWAPDDDSTEWVNNLNVRP